MNHALTITSRRLFQFSFFNLAVFVPFSIAGTNISLGFAALAWMFGIVAARTGPSPEIPPIRRDPMLLPSILLVISAVPSLLMSDNFQRAYTDWKSYWALLIYFLVAANLVASRMREPLFWVLLASTIASCVVAFIQRAGGIDFWFVHIGGEHRVGSTLFTMTFAGILYQLIVFNASVLLTRALALRTRILLAAGVVFPFIAILLTMTRGAWVALVAGLLAVCLLVRTRVVAAAAVVMVVAALGFSFVYSGDQGRTISIGALFSSTPDRNVHTRLVLWDIAWDLFKAHPLLGVGMGDYTEEAEELLEGRKVWTTVDSHNIPLHILATRGLVGFVPFVFFWVVMLRMLFRQKRQFEKGSREYQYLVGAIAVTVAILVGALTENNIDDEEIFMTFMVLIGFARSEAYRPRSISPSTS